MLTYILFIIGFVVLIKGADLLVKGASSIAKEMHISPLVIGLTIVSFGTSAPELIVNLFASASGKTDLAIGNILGSNIANVFLILGVSALIYPLTTKKNTVWKEIPFSLLAAILLTVLVSDKLIDGSDFSRLSRIDGIVLISFFIIFLYYTFGIAKVKGESNESDIPVYSLGLSILFVILGLTGLTFGGKWIVDGAVEIAAYFEMSESMIGLTVVAIGTSLPELATSAMAAYRKQSDIAIGNVVGSNIFNIFLILGISSTVNPLPFNPESSMDVAMTILASLTLFIVLFIGKKHVLERWQGGLMLFIYLSYMAYLVSNC